MNKKESVSNKILEKTQDDLAKSSDKTGGSFKSFAQNAKDLAKPLAALGFAVLALGDTAFDLFCESGKEWDRILEEKGGTRVHERIDCDTDYEDFADEWISEALAKLQSV